MAVQIQLRRDTAANWDGANPILQAGELGVDLTSGRMKLGDGFTAWQALPWYEENLIDASGNVKPSANANGVALNVDLDDPGLLSGLISRIIGPVESNEHGSYVRLENGLQLCWKNHQIPASVAVSVANSGWGYRSSQQGALFPAAFIENARTFAVANINTVGYFATSGASSAASFTFHFVSGANVTVPSGAFVNLLAMGRWK